MSESSFDRRELTFEQAEGAEPLPQQMALKKISDVLAARLFNAIYSHLASSVANYGEYIQGPWAAVMKRHFIERQGKLSDEFKPSLHTVAKQLKAIYSTKDYIKILGTTEWLARHSGSTTFPAAVEHILIEERAAYRLVDKRDIVPLVSEFEGKAFTTALAAMSDHGLDGARSHLKAAGRAITSAKYASSVRESIQAIESAARMISPSSKFSDALSQIEAVHDLHPALKKGLNSLYGYSSDEEGIRHPLLERGDANVREEDAILMLGICSAAVTYLVSKVRP